MLYRNRVCPHGAAYSSCRIWYYKPHKRIGMEYIGLVKEGLVTGLISGFVIGVLAAIAFTAIVGLLGGEKDDEFNFDDKEPR